MLEFKRIYIFFSNLNNYLIKCISTEIPILILKGFISAKRHPGWVWHWNVQFKMNKSTENILEQELVSKKPKTCSFKTLLTWIEFMVICTLIGVIIFLITSGKWILSFWYTIITHDSEKLKLLSISNHLVTAALMKYRNSANSYLLWIVFEPWIVPEFY